MAKRRTLRRQRDKALKELAEYKRMEVVRRIDNTMMSQRVYEQVACLRAFYDYHDIQVACGLINEQAITRSLLHRLVDEGNFDQAVTSNTVKTGFKTNRLLIALNVLKPEQTEIDL